MGSRVVGWLCATYGAVATLLVAAIAVVGDRQAWTYVVASVFFWWLVPAPVLFVAALVLRAWRPLALVVVPAAVFAFVEGPGVWHAVHGPAASTVDLSVATYNMTNGVPSGGLVTLAADFHPDVLLLQEVTYGRREMAALLPSYPYASMGLGVSGPGHDGYAVLSRYPVVRVRPVTGLPEGSRPTDVVTLDVAGRKVSVISVHLASPCILCADPALNPAGSTGHAARVRIAEADRYRDVVSELIRQGHPVVLAGDLNSSELNEPLGILTDAGLTDAQRALGAGPGLTRGPGPGVTRVDVVLTHGLRPVHVAVGSPGDSAHSPVVVDLAWTTDSRR